MGYTDRNQRQQSEEEWKPITKLGKLVKNGNITSLDEIFAHSLRIQEPEIVDYLLQRNKISEELMSVKSVQKQSKSGQKTSMKVVAVVGNRNGIIGVGTHSAKEMSDAMKGAVKRAKMNVIPVRRGQWQGEGENLHTVAAMASGKAGSVRVKIIPAPIGTGNAYGDVQRRIFELAGINDIFVNSFGCTRTKENMVKATVNALENSSKIYLPSDWAVQNKEESPLTKFGEELFQIESANSF